MKNVIAVWGDESQTNPPLAWVLTYDMDTGRHEVEPVYPDDMPPTMAALCGPSAAMNRAMVRIENTRRRLGGVAVNGGDA